jgi:predicted O-methyltransferase YrrM
LRRIDPAVAPQLSIAMTSALEHARRLRRELRFLLALRVLPRRVALFQWRARRLALRRGDVFGPASSTRPEKLAALLGLAENRLRVVELGTATGWTTASLLLADRRREVLSYDVVQRPGLDQYLDLAGAGVRRRLELVCAAGDEGPRSDRTVDLLYIDSSHERSATIREVRVWRPVLAAGAVVVFDDYTHSEYPGVREAVEELGLQGYEIHGLFVHEVRAAASAAINETT